MNVYLSHSKSDRYLAKEIASYLKAQRGMDVWLPEEQLLPGDNWAAKVGSVLEDADAMVVLLSPDSMKSEWVRHDIEYALGTAQFKGRLIPVMIKSTSDIPWILNTSKCFKASKILKKLPRPSSRS
jgi:hypothetical protein